MIENTLNTSANLTDYNKVPVCINILTIQIQWFPCKIISAEINLENNLKGSSRTIIKLICTMHYGILFPHHYGEKGINLSQEDSNYSCNNLNLNSVPNVKQYLTLKRRCRLIKVENNFSNEGIIVNTLSHTQSHLQADKMNILHPI